MSAAIELRGAGKRYLQTAQSETTLLRRLARIGRRGERRGLWALRDIDLTVAQGETIGIIGRNGSGKTTLLRLLSGVSAPSTGRVRVVGRVAPLIGIGVGFNQELTGRENVLVNGRLLGMSDAEVRRKYDAIVEFSEIEHFIDSPVKFYSSGMFLRLAFAVAIHTEPEVFVLDEILAVGDLAFQLKCMERMREIQARGTTIVIVTHNLHTLDRTASRSVLLSHGQLVFDGPTEQAIGQMHEVMQAETRDRGSSAELLLQEGSAVAFVGGADVIVEIVDAGGRRERSFATGDSMTLRVTATFDSPVVGPLLGIMVAPIGLGTPAYITYNTPGSYRRKHGPAAPLQAEISLAVNLLGGGYNVTVGVYDGDGKTQLGAARPESFYVSSAHIHAAGVVDLDARIVVGGRELPKPRRNRLGGAGPTSAAARHSAG
jgi:ABC-2 type transport system ATP-binding protein